MAGGHELRSRRLSEVRKDPPARDVAVLTSATPEYYPFLPDAGASLLTQRSVAQWVVVHTGPLPPPTQGEFDRVAIELKEHGVAVSLLRLPSGHNLPERQNAAVTPAARNYALDKVKTEYLAPLDADDRWLSGGIDRLRREFDQRKLAAALGDVQRFGPEWVPLEESSTLGEWGDQYLSADTIGRFSYGALPWAFSPMVARSEAVRAVGGWPGLCMGEDRDLLLAIVALGEAGRLSQPEADGRVAGAPRDRRPWVRPGCVRIVNEQIYGYRQWDGNTSRPDPGAAATKREWLDLVYSRFPGRHGMNNGSRLPSGVTPARRATGLPDSGTPRHLAGRRSSGRMT